MIRTIVLCVLLLGLVTGCARIPSEAPGLSQALGSRITAIRAAHMTLLKRYFDEKRDEVDAFIDTQWVPMFAENLFRDPRIAAVWHQVVMNGDEHDRVEFLVRVGPKLQRKINAKRRELIKPLNELEETIQAKLDQDYTTALAMNNSITSFLTSAAQVDANRQRYMELMGVNDAAVGNAITEVDEAVSMLLSKAESVDEKVRMAEEYIARLQKLKAKLN